MRTKLHPKRPLGIAVATGGIYNAARKRYDLQPTHYKSLDKPLEHFNDNGTHFFFIGNSIFHLSLELLTKFWKMRLNVA